MKSEFSEKLLMWNTLQNNRPMPWKGETDPYKIWLSEIILQQTRVEQGWKYYEAFISTFPTVTDLAQAQDAVVFKLWEGLGYYSRCRNLLLTARYIAHERDGQFPGTYDELIKLKGIGAYTAAAIASFAFKECRAVVDGNVQRIISRYFGINTPTDTGAGKKLYQELAQAMIDEEQPDIYNQAIMDFGATVCKPRQPLCSSCVQKDDCEAFRLGIVESLPVKEKKLIKKERWFSYYVIETPSSVYVRQRNSRDIWNSLHEFILMETKHAPDEHAHQVFLQQLLQSAAYQITAISPPVRQILSHQVIHGRFIHVALQTEAVNIPGYVAIARESLAALAFPGLINSYLLHHAKVF